MTHYAADFDVIEPLLNLLTYVDVVLNVLE